MKQDPDLDQAIKSLKWSARRLRHLQALLAQPEDPATYRKLTAMEAELTELREQFSIRGERLKMAGDRALAGRALLMVTEEADRLEVRHRRRPTFLQLLEAMRVAGEHSVILRNEAAADATLADYARKIAVHNTAAVASAVSYMEASR